MKGKDMEINRDDADLAIRLFESGILSRGEAREYLGISSKDHAEDQPTR